MNALQITEVVDILVRCILVLKKKKKLLIDNEFCTKIISYRQLQHKYTEIHKICVLNTLRFVIKYYNIHYINLKKYIL